MHCSDIVTHIVAMSLVGWLVGWLIDWVMWMYCGQMIEQMSHIVESCHLTKLNGGLSRLHSADEDAVSWLTNYGK